MVNADICPFLMVKIQIFRTVHFNEMREVLNDKQDMKHLILDRVDEQLAAEVRILLLFYLNLILLFYFIK